ncbi:amino-acid N-acetyltransferase [Brevibacterium marinum]|uniref:Amino-acid N-acetyltransferase n=1 Tax=Brevibacterium marinum TaxID=418643 RepID=A0A846RX22_9MICO|nr:amino-acid N-acetyltransferase [Brevibacterium marinum]NJC58359.1 amino-acid N-acetyltransferase [Brevibacterium marinum]
MSSAPVDFDHHQVSSDHHLNHSLPSGLYLRRARTSDVKAIEELVAPLAEERILLAKDTVTYFETLQEFWLVVDPQPDGSETLAGCGALHVIWTDLAEARTVATSPDYRGRGVGKALIRQLLADAAAIGVDRVFCLTFETGFFGSLGFEPIKGIPVSPEVYVELLHSADEGVAEFLDLARVKPNTLGNARMIKFL